MRRILLTGIAVQDFVFAVDEMPARAEKYRATSLRMVGGGIAANAAVAVARLGGRASLATRLGDDAVGAGIRAELEREGVDLGLTLVAPGRASPLSSIFVDKRGERMIMSYSDAALPSDTAHLPARLPDDVDAVLGDTRWPEGSVHAFRLARAAGRPSVLDYDRGLGDRAILGEASHVAMSMQALRDLSGDAAPVPALSALARTYDNWLAVTDGENGVWHTGADRAIRHVPAFAVDTVDTLGAGDVWHGAFALALAEGRDEADAVRFASAAAAIKCTRFGGRAGIPARAEVEAFLNEKN